MNHLLKTGAQLFVCATMLSTTAAAHGGQYRGPSDVRAPDRSRDTPTGGDAGRAGAPPSPPSRGQAAVQPGTGNRGGANPGFPNPRGPAGPTTGAGPGRQAGGGQADCDDLTAWQFWWEFHKDPFLRLRDAVHRPAATTGDDDFFVGSRRKHASRDRLKPTKDDVLGVILPALKKAIDSTDQRDITTSCMVAMAKIGRDHPEFRLIDVFSPRLAARNQETRETAALAIGIAATGGAEELDLLISLACDDSAGRKACGGTVNHRTRTFALYALGLTASATDDVEIKRRAFEALRTTLNDDDIRDRNSKVAAIHGMSILAVNTVDPSTADKALLSDVLTTLDTFFMRRGGAGTNLIQAHCPPAIAKLLGRDHPDTKLVEGYKARFVAELLGKGIRKRTHNTIGQSCAIALGQLCRPYDDEGSSDAEHSRMLLRLWQKHRDQQTRFFALLSLGWIGGQGNRAALIHAFDSGNKGIEKPWAALALGILAHRSYETQTDRDDPPVVDKLIGQTLFEELKQCRNPDLGGALAIGLGLTRYLDAADLMRAEMLRRIAQEELAGYLAVGLALMQDAASKESVREVVGLAPRRFRLLQQAAIALGKLGDKQVADQLLDLIREGEPNLARLGAIASAIGVIGDRRSIEPLKAMLFDDRFGDLSRAFAAVALGSIADKEALPWNSKLGMHANYRAAVETLTNGYSGILDIL